jgi:uncharacterized protein (TIGR02231 family)
MGTGRAGEVSGRVLDDSGEPLIGATISIRGTATGTVTDIDGNFNLKLPNANVSLVISYIGYTNLDVPVTNSGQVIQVYLSSSEMMLSEVVVTGYATKKRMQRRDKTEAAPPAPPPVTVVQLPTTYLYEIDVPITLASDGKLQLVDIKNYELPAEYRYYCTPKLDLSAYLTAQMTGWETIGLLSGEANLFFEGTYLGKSFLEFASTEDTLELSLGRDRNIVVGRTKQKDFTKKLFFGGKKEDSRTFEIAVKNKKTQAITLVIEDQFPVSTNKEIDVERGETSDGQVDDVSGLISWTLPLESTAEKKVRFGYKVKYSKAQRITLE